MCGKRSLNASVLSDNDETTPGQTHSPDIKVVSSSNGVANKVKKEEETVEEKRRRRKLERVQRKLTKLQRNKQLHLIAGKGLTKKTLKQFNTTWDRESEFVTQVMQCLPEVRQPGLLLDEEERAEEHMIQTEDGMDEMKEEDKRKKFFAKVRRNLEKEGVEATTERAKTYQELKERLHRKLRELAQKPNEQKREKKMKKKLKRAQEAKEKSNKGKKLISQSAASAGAVAEESSANSQSEQSEKTPLKKKPVVKSNGEIVYSKFDFISKHKGDNSNSLSTSLNESQQNSKGSVKPKADELLKKAEKFEKKISNLATHGKKSEAVSLAETQKWDTALKRADGEKVRDDAYLLKKTIKKQEKLKQLSKKKWKERVERVEKQKELRQQKRQTNIQARKDDNKKRTKKIMRKRGRIA